jgi:type VI secretion system protein ImpK
MSADQSTSKKAKNWLPKPGNAPGEVPSLAIPESVPAGSFAPGPNHDTRLAEVRLALEEKRNPFLEAARVLLRSLAELPKTLEPEGVQGLHTLLTQELRIYTRLCEQANLRRDHMLVVRYVLCTALDEAISLQPWAGGEGEQTGIWSTQDLLSEFHGERGGGETVFLLIGRLANAAEEHVFVLEVIHHVLSLGFMGNYRVKANGHREWETIRHRLYAMAAAGREPVARELSPRWRGVGEGKFKLLRSVPVWASASVLGLVLFGQFGWYKYELLVASAQVRKDIEALDVVPPAVRAAVPVALNQKLNLTQLLRAEIASGRVKVLEDAQHAVVTFKGDGMFSGGLDKLSTGTLATLDKVASALQQVGGTVNVTGHTDNQPIATPAFPSNQVLSEKRAQSVVDFLKSKGIEAGRLKALGKGDTAPEASNTTPTGRAANRRVEIEVVAADAKRGPQPGGASASSATSGKAGR